MSFEQIKADADRRVAEAREMERRAIRNVWIAGVLVAVALVNLGFALWRVLS